MEAENKRLKQQLKKKDRQIEKLEKELSRAKQKIQKLSLVCEICGMCLANSQTLR